MISQEFVLVTLVRVTPETRGPSVPGWGISSGARVGPGGTSTALLILLHIDLLLGTITRGQPYNKLRKGPSGP